MNLLVIRHAIAMEREEYQSMHPGASDDLRPLTDDGLRKMRKCAKGLVRLVPSPDLVLSSPLTRALQTRDVLARLWPDVTQEVSEAMRPDANPERLAAWLSKHPESLRKDATVAVIGHEPHVTAMVAWFMNGSLQAELELKKGGACLIRFAKKPARGSGQLVWLATPAMLRTLAKAT